MSERIDDVLAKLADKPALQHALRDLYQRAAFVDQIPAHCVQQPNAKGGPRPEEAFGDIAKDATFGEIRRHDQTHEAMIEWLYGWSTNVRNGLNPARPLVILHGERGRGKSHLLYCIADRICDRRDYALMPLQAWLGLIKESYTPGPNRRFHDLDTATRHALKKPTLLDEVGNGRLTDADIAIMRVAFDEVWKNRRPIAMTTNETPQGLGMYFARGFVEYGEDRKPTSAGDAAVNSRISATAKAFYFSAEWPDMRGRG